MPKSALKTCMNISQLLSLFSIANLALQAVELKAIILGYQSEPKPCNERD